MKLKNKTIVMTLGVLVTVLFAHSCFRQKQEKKDDLPRIDRAQLCRDGGASFTEATNECVCSSGLVWNGVRCDVVSKPVADAPVEQPPAPKKVEPQPTSKPKEPTPTPVADAPAVVETPVAPAKPAEEIQSGEPDWLPVLKRACRIANGSWLKKHQYCHCPDGKVLMGRRCRPMNGRMMDDVCRRAVIPGSWQNGVCMCPATQVFSPGLGGCVDTGVVDKTLLRRICENTMNQGRWNERLDQCGCPSGKQLVGETCVKKTKLQSSVVCKSEGGVWNVEGKVCSCPEQKLWINQSCRAASTVDAETACLGEVNRGKWNKKKGMCTCPDGQRWIASRKICLPR